MGQKFIISFLVIIGFSFCVHKSYGCTQPPNALLTASPNPVCIGCQVTLDGSGSTDDGQIVKYEWDWTNDGTYDYSESPGDGKAEYIYNTEGIYTAKLQVTDNLGLTDTATCELTVVKVQNLQYLDPQSGYTDITSTLYVRIGTTVTFKAIPSPSGASWPNGKPVWGGTSGASGTGPTTDVTFNTISTSISDYKTVTAECGNTETANVIVYDFEGTLVPEDNFQYRSQSDYGLEELVYLGCDITPTGLSASQVGGLEWGIIDGVGTLSNITNNGTALYDAGELDGDTTFILAVISGPSYGTYHLYGRNVVSPDQTRMTRVNNNVWHTKGSASAGISLYYWLDPTNVSFKNLTFGEGSCPATGAIGIYVTVPPGNHPQNTFGAILGGNSTTGCRVSAIDYAGSLRNPWNNGGTYTWNIPTQYIDDTATRNTFGSNSIQSPTIQANGDATLSKRDQSGSAQLDANTMGW